MLKLSFYVPESHLEGVKQAVFEAGAGRYDYYDEVCWQTMGKGQFRSLSGSQPAIGEQDVLTFVDEYKVEMICSEEHVDGVIAALKQAHPYEKPAFEFFLLFEY